MTEPTERRPPSRTFTWISLGLAAGLVLGGGAAWMLIRRLSSPPAPAAPRAEAAPQQAYQCPMHPQIIRDHPGTCPICGMDLVAMEGPRERVASGAVTISAERQQLMGLRTAKVELGPVGGGLRASARIVPDETRVRKVTVKVEGFVEKLQVDFLGKPVAQGQTLFTLYSPEFVSAQQELLLALRTRGAMKDEALKGRGDTLVEAARRRLALWDVSAEAIAELERSGQARKALPLTSPISGVVTAKNVVEGARLAAGDAPFEITDLSRVWALVDVFEGELGRVKVGQGASLTLQGRTFQGRVAFIDPVLDPRTRTAKVRVEVPNPKGELRPEMYGEAVLEGGTRKVLTVPADAVLDSGTRKVVFVALGEGRFEPREVATGEVGGDRVEIIEGLGEGEQVVTRAAFLVDSESRLKAALADLGAKGPDPKHSGHGH